MNSWPPGDGNQEGAEVEVVNTVERGDHIEAGGPHRQLLGGCQQRYHLKGVAPVGALSYASMAAETSAATSREPSGSTARSSREYRPVPQPTSGNSSSLDSVRL
jgi:hypothetical protein